MSESKKRLTNEESRRQTATLKPAELSLFCYQLSVIFHSGIPLLDGMKLFADEMDNATLKKVGNQLYQDVYRGKTFYESISQQPLFPAYMVGMLAIAEQTGRLDQETLRLSSYYERLDAIEQKVKNSIVYPVILGVMMGAVILLLIFRVLPLFHQILESIGGQVPASTRAMINLSQSLLQYSSVLLVGVLTLGALLWLYQRSAEGKRQFDRIRLSLPVVGTFTRKMIAFRLSHAMSLLVGGGLSFNEALAMCEGIVDNHLARTELNQCRNSIESGNSPQEAFHEMTTIPSLMKKMVSLGIQTGELDGFLARSTNVYEKETERSLHRLTSSIEPALVFVLSVIVGIILLAVMFPLVRILSTIG